MVSSDMETEEDSITDEEPEIAAQRCWENPMARLHDSPQSAIRPFKLPSTPPVRRQAMESLYGKKQLLLSTDAGVSSSNSREDTASPDESPVFLFIDEVGGVREGPSSMHTHFFDPWQSLGPVPTLPNRRSRVEVAAPPERCFRAKPPVLHISPTVPIPNRPFPGKSSEAIPSSNSKLTSDNGSFVDAHSSGVNVDFAKATVTTQDSCSPEEVFEASHSTNNRDSLSN